MCRYRLQCKDNNCGQQPGGTADVGYSRTGEVRHQHVRWRKRVYDVLQLYFIQLWHFDKVTVCHCFLSKQCICSIKSNFLCFLVSCKTWNMSHFFFFPCAVSCSSRLTVKLSVLNVIHLSKFSCENTIPVLLQVVQVHAKREFSGIFEVPVKTQDFLFLSASSSSCRYRSITKQFFRKADGVVVMYEITAEQSFTAVRQWLTSVKVRQ